MGKLKSIYKKTKKGISKGIRFTEHAVSKSAQKTTKFQKRFKKSPITKFAIGLSKGTIDSIGLPTKIKGSKHKIL